MAQIQTTVFGPIDLDVMNESDVEQVIVRPLLHALGYRQGSENNIQTQIPLRYDKAYLGHRDSKRDPVLRGKPDFVCDAIPLARWVIEAKGPKIPLTIEDSEQAHTYSTHPEIAAEFYVLTNGREFRIYRVGRPKTPILSWNAADTDGMLPQLRNLLGPEAMRKRATVFIDLGKPLADGLPSALDIVGGHIVFDSHVANIPLPSGTLDGLQNSVSGIGVSRTQEGFIEARVIVKASNSAIDQINQALGLHILTFKTDSEFVSSNIETPTHFSNFFEMRFPAGIRLPALHGMPASILPFAIDVACFTQAVGFISQGHFKGTFIVEYDYLCDTKGTVFAAQFNSFKMFGEGRFDIIVRSPDSR